MFLLIAKPDQSQLALGRVKFLTTKLWISIHL